MLLAATGMRATEALSTRITDLDFDSNPPKLFVRGEYTKTKVDRIIFLTEEVTHGQIINIVLEGYPIKIKKQEKQSLKIEHLIKVAMTRYGPVILFNIIKEQTFRQKGSLTPQHLLCYLLCCHTCYVVMLLVCVLVKCKLTGLQAISPNQV